MLIVVNRLFVCINMVLICVNRLFICINMVLIGVSRLFTRTASAGLPPVFTPSVMKRITRWQFALFPVSRPLRKVANAWKEGREGGGDTRRQREETERR